MAIFAFSTDGPHRAPPIAAHPAFPWIVALWFAALLGLGMLALPSALFERLALAAELPFGSAARLPVALAAAAAGALAGFLLARGIAVAPHEAGGPTPAEEAPRRPLSARDELGDLLDWDAPRSSDPGPGTALAPADVDRAGGLRLVALIAQLRKAIEDRDARLRDVARADAVDAALRAVLTRLRELREAT